MQTSLLVSKFGDASINKALKTIDQKVTEEEVRSLRHEEDYVFLDWKMEGARGKDLSTASSTSCVP